MSRAALIATMLIAGLLVAESATRQGSAPLVWNASASVPIGLYRLAPVGRLAVGDLVVVVPPEPLASFLAERGYLPHGVPMLKRVLALTGTAVCRRSAIVTADDAVYGAALERDSQGRPLPSWQGCRMLAQGEVFLMNWDAADSFDGRYFGQLPGTAVTARALPVWTDTDGDGRFRWSVDAP